MSILATGGRLLRLAAPLALQRANRQFLQGAQRALSASWTYARDAQRSFHNLHWNIFCRKGLHGIA
eukprot:scaffold3841_cov412-Prasinococcus_capsulatus_cf.AAC.18